MSSPRSPQDPARPPRRRPRTHDKGLARKLNSTVFPGNRGGPLMHVISAKAVAFGDALCAEFRDHATPLSPRKNLAATFRNSGLDIVSDSTDCHMLPVDPRPKGVKGRGPSTPSRPRFWPRYASSPTRLQSARIEALILVSARLTSQGKHLKFNGMTRYARVRSRARQGFSRSIRPKGPRMQRAAPRRIAWRG